MIHTLTSRSIESYKRQTPSKLKSLTRATSAEISGSFSRSIIRRQHEMIRSKQQDRTDQQHYSSRHTANSNGLILPSDLVNGLSKGSPNSSHHPHYPHQSTSLSINPQHSANQGSF